MRRRDFAIGLLLATGVGTARAQERAQQHRIAIVIPAGAVAIISETSSDPIRRRFYQPFFQELRRLGDVESESTADSRNTRTLCRSNARQTPAVGDSPGSRGMRLFTAA
jgi:hypothetical protein